MTPKTLRFRARGTSLVQIFEKLDAGIKKFIGWTYGSPSPGEWAFTRNDEDVEVQYAAEYVKACKDGHLWPSDAETATACGMPFDPHFGDEAAPAQAELALEPQHAAEEPAPVSTQHAA